MKKLIGIWYLSVSSLSFSYEYKVDKIDNHVLHVVTLNPNDYNIDLVKGYNKVIGREKLSSIARRSNAEIAINAGFFEIGNNKDGMPSRNLVIEGAIYGLVNRDQPVVINAKGKLHIQTINPTIILRLGHEEIIIKKVNKPAEKEDIVLYTNTYSSSTLTSYKDRNELIFDNLGNLIKVSDHGNNTINELNYIISLPKSLSIDKVRNKINLNIPDIIRNKSSFVSGIPLLIDNNVILQDVKSNDNNFTKTHQARTALGIKASGEIVLLVAEHIYKSDLYSSNLADVKSIIQEKAKVISKKYGKNYLNLTLGDIKDFLKNESSSVDKSVLGLKLSDLAQYMHTLGCKQAINLDGGGSSTMWIKNRIVNQTIGDKDESKGLVIERPISDAIVFVRR